MALCVPLILAVFTTPAAPLNSEGETRRLEREDGGGRAARRRPNANFERESAGATRISEDRRRTPRRFNLKTRYDARTQCLRLLDSVIQPKPSRNARRGLAVSYIEKSNFEGRKIHPTNAPARKVELRQRLEPVLGAGREEDAEEGGVSEASMGKSVSFNKKKKEREQGKRGEGGEILGGKLRQEEVQADRREKRMKEPKSNEQATHLNLAIRLDVWILVLQSDNDAELDEAVGWDSQPPP
ncbi:hypothetical protein K438DRAFT_1773220 [Mycena galopus ATCC 62051]|nr:hypothetical protein K438DRAFT_1773220 [Mycena galopus ATCC 62051]